MHLTRRAEPRKNKLIGPIGLYIAKLIGIATTMCENVNRPMGIIRPVLQQLESYHQMNFV